jgi:hypothetical protein
MGKAITHFHHFQLPAPWTHIANKTEIFIPERIPGRMNDHSSPTKQITGVNTAGICPRFFSQYESRDLFNKDTAS